MVTLTSGILLPVTTAAAARSGVLAIVPFCLPEVVAGGFSTIDCVEFCLALDEAGLPFVGGGVSFASAFDSGNVVRIGEEASEGDITEVTVLFLFDW
jgi:hypothetical protein